jgi:hypothetical protein
MARLAPITARGNAHDANDHRPERKCERPSNQIAKDLGISEGCLRNWLNQADIDSGRREGLTRRHPLRRAHGVGHDRQTLNLLGDALMVNALALHRNRRRRAALTA